MCWGRVDIKFVTESDDNGEQDEVVLRTKYWSYRTLVETKVTALFWTSCSMDITANIQSFFVLRHVRAQIY